MAKTEMQNSVEKILDKLSTLGDITTADEPDKQLIVEVLQKLPKRIRQKVLNEVTFIFTQVKGCNIPLFIPHRIKAKDLHKVDGAGFDYVAPMELHFIMLNFPTMRKRSKTSKMAVVAHEIAHFVLRHDLPDDHSKIKEREADDLAVKWGFIRSYKHYE